MGMNNMYMVGIRSRSHWSSVLARRIETTTEGAAGRYI